MKQTKSKKMFATAQKYLVGGVNSPVRAFRGVGGTPFFVTRGKGAYIWDSDGNKYIDYVGSWGALLFGHAEPTILKSVKSAVEKGTSFGIPTAQETELAQLIQNAVPSMEKIRLVNSGTEATMSAIRLARGFTKRNTIIKFDGCYHGHGDSLLVQAGSGAMMLGTPDSAGVPADFAKHTISLPYNDLNAVKKVFAKMGNKIAGIIVEPVCGNMGVILPREEFLPGLRELCTQYSALLIVDEVMTGFRVAYGGAQSVYKIKPDLTTLGKIIGGGLPVGAYGGRKEIMDLVAPLGSVYQAGTLSGNPISVAAGIAMLKLASQKKVYQKLKGKTRMLSEGIQDAAKRTGIPIYSVSIGSMFCSFFTAQPVYDYTTAKLSDTKRYAKYFHRMLESGVYFVPSQFEAGFVSAAHTEQDIEKTIRAAYSAFKKLR
ncbi:MAG: glutamate-1-semialdehyde 2,1-aminomutase [bacterium]|nr:glutamate-1-semialdehyde 2,1-aminomutase [bacterium]